MYLKKDCPDKANEITQVSVIYRNELRHEGET